MKVYHVLVLYLHHVRYIATGQVVLLTDDAGIVVGDRHRICRVLIVNIPLEQHYVFIVDAVAIVQVGKIIKAILNRLCHMPGLIVGALHQLRTHGFGVIEKHVHWPRRQFIHPQRHIHIRLRPVRQEQYAGARSAAYKYRVHIIPYVIGDVGYFSPLYRKHVQVCLAVLYCREHQFVIVLGKGHTQHTVKTFVRYHIVFFPVIQAVIYTQLCF